MKKWTGIVMWGAFAFSIALITACDALFPVLLRVIQAADPDYALTAGTTTSIAITNWLWGLAVVSWIVVLRPNQVHYAILINILIAIAILGLFMMSALTQILTVLPMP